MMGGASHGEAGRELEESAIWATGSGGSKAERSAGDNTWNVVQEGFV